MNSTDLPAVECRLDGGIVPLLASQLEMHTVGPLPATRRQAAVTLLAQAAEIERLHSALERIEIKAQAGLCYFTLESAREFLKDVRDEVADALNTDRPQR
jgi:hypothetical protein